MHCYAFVITRYGSFTAPLFLYTTLAVDKVNGRGLSNTAHRERLLKKMATSYSRITRQYQLVGVFQL